MIKRDSAPSSEHSPAEEGLPVILLIGLGGAWQTLAAPLTRKGWTVTAFEREGKAREWLDGSAAEIIVLQASGAIGRGVSTLRRLADAAPGAIRILVLDKPDANAAIRYLNEGGADFLLPAPADPKRLNQAVTLLWNRREADGKAWLKVHGAQAVPPEYQEYKLQMENRLRHRNLELSRANQELRHALDEIEEKNKALTLLNESLKIQSTTDPLTGLFNRREFIARIRSEWSRSHRYRRPLALIMLDIDHFKRINDTHGHECGDRVLQTLGELIRRNKRAQDVTCRYGGEEFVVLLPETSLDAAFHVAEGLRQLVGNYTFRYKGRRIQVHVSMGVAGLIEHKPETVDAFINLADAAMYRAKGEGRNRTMVVDPGTPDHFAQQSSSGENG